MPVDGGLRLSMGRRQILAVTISTLCMSYVLIKHVSTVGPRVSAIISTLELQRHREGNKYRWAITQCTLWVCSTFRQIVALSPARCICPTNLPSGSIQASFLLQLSRTSTLSSAALVFVIHHSTHVHYCPSWLTVSSCFPTSNIARGVRG